jgi:Ca2+-binding RTX toxin-like protein
VPTLRLTALSIAIVALLTASAIGAEITCGSYPTGRCVETGTAAADVITGSHLNDTQRGLGGNDRLRGGLGNDTQDGGSGDDSIDGAAGNDQQSGGSGNDFLKGGTGFDVMSGGRGNDRLIGGSGGDVISGGDGNDKIDARDKRRDDVNCGAGKHDRARVDKVDRVRGCEVVTSA